MQYLAYLLNVWHLLNSLCFPTYHVLFSDTSLAMGGCLSNEDRSPETFHQKDKKETKEDEVVRFFMVGMGSAGKSTVIKQLQKLCHIQPEIYQMYDEEWKPISHSFKSHELQRWSKMIRVNIIDAMYVLVKHAEDWNTPLSSPEATETSRLIYSDGDQTASSRWENEPQLVDKIVHLFQDPTIQSTFDKRAQMNTELQLTDGTIYFLNEAKIREVFQDDYLPTDDDILHARDPTTGITDYRFSVHNFKIMIHDIGGQKVERAKIMNYINNWVSSDRQNYRNFILYVVSIAEYNVRHPVHKRMTLLDESLKLLENILQLQPVQNCGLMLFLNKEDIFKDKVNRCKDLEEVRKETVECLGRFMKPSVKEKLETSGKFSYKDIQACIGAKFAHVVTNEKLKRNKAAYFRYTCAVDTKGMSSIFAAIQDQVNQTMVDTVDWMP